MWEHVVVRRVGRVGRPPSIDSPPCPECERTEAVGSHGIQDVDGQPRRAFRCSDCERAFVPGVDPDKPSPELKQAVARVRSETDAPYRLIADAISRHLGISVSHTAVRTWCDERQPQADGHGVGDVEDAASTVEEEALACEYLSVLWALRHEIQDEARAETGAETGAGTGTGAGS